MDWTPIVSSIASVIVILLIPIGWGAKMLLSIERRTTILETKDKTDGRTLESINKKVSGIADSVQIINIAIAKIETVLKSRSDDSVQPQRPQ
jgi:hypothetical protein